MKTDASSFSFFRSFFRFRKTVGPDGKQLPPHQYAGGAADLWDVILDTKVKGKKPICTSLYPPCFSCSSIRLTDASPLFLLLLQLWSPHLIDLPLLSLLIRWIGYCSSEFETLNSKRGTGRREKDETRADVSLCFVALPQPRSSLPSRSSFERLQL